MNDLYDDGHFSHGQVYVIMFSSGVIKVGRSTNPDSRIKTHEKAESTGCVLRFVGGCGCQEQDLKRFAQNHMGAPIQGSEWFYGSPELFSLLSGLISSYAEVDRTAPTPEQIGARVRQIRETGVQQYIDQIVASAPPLTDAQADRIRALLAPSKGV
jgi:hypothetical protein